MEGAAVMDGSVVAVTVAVADPTQTAITGPPADGIKPVTAG